MGIQEALAKQERSVVLEYEKRVQNTVVHFAEQGMNATLWYKNKDFRKWVSIIPTSAISGEGVPDLLLLAVQLTQRLMADRLLYLQKLQCTVLEVKSFPLSHFFSSSITLK
jgi:translation initiation factor 5B